MRSVFDSFLLRLIGCVVVVCCLLSPVRSDADDKKKTATKPKKKQATPKVLMAVPFYITAGAEGTITLRGLNLDKVQNVYAGATAKNNGVEVKLVRKGKASIPDKRSANRVGNTQLIVQLKVRADFKEPFVPIGFKPSSSSAQPYMIEVIPRERHVKEKEPNGGFRQAQLIKPGMIVTGEVSAAKDVDVFAIEGKKGAMLRVEFTAAQRGSALDGVLTLFDSKSNIVAQGDDSDGSLDPAIRVKLPHDGTYYLSLIDAYDQGSDIHPYRLTVEIVQK